MKTLLLNLANDLSEGLGKCKYIDCKSGLEYMAAKDRCLVPLNCHKNYEKDFNKNLIKIFENTSRFCNKGINIICLILR